MSGKDTEYFSWERQKERRRRGCVRKRGRMVKGQHRRLVERHGLPTTRGPLRDRGLNSAQECRGASPFQGEPTESKT